MAFVRKNLGTGQLSTTETTIYQPSAPNISGTVGKLTFYNTSTTSQVTITVYSSHSGSATTSDILDYQTLNPQETYICRPAVNEVIATDSRKISAIASTASTINYSCSGAEEQ